MLLTTAADLSNFLLSGISFFLSGEWPGTITELVLVQQIFSWQKHGKESARITVLKATNDEFCVFPVLWC